MALTETIDLDTTEAKAKLDELEEQVDRILEKLDRADRSWNANNQRRLNWLWGNRGKYE